ncbi:HEPN domain-containing protein [Haloarcula sp. CGMCC 1.6347]|uniref:HEPN domain-containing protein n=1 Tax=Haloarcula sp. CGMCC 1.6347 TaxID=3111455 RepID=UPI00300F023B
MTDFDDVPVEDLAYAKRQLLQSSMRLSQIKNEYHLADEDAKPDEISSDDLNEIMLEIGPEVVISDCQVCVELSAKAIFKSVGVNPPQHHDIEFTDNRVKGLLSSLEKDYDEIEEIYRVLFLTQFWERFYTLAKYGAPEQNIPSSSFMDPRDAKRAVDDAEFCLDTAMNLHDYVLDQKEMSLDDFDFDLYLDIETIDPHS